MMRKIGLKRPNKLNLGPKKVSPPIIPGAGGQRISAVYSEDGEAGGQQGTMEFNISFDSVHSDSTAGGSLRSAPAISAGIFLASAAGAERRECESATPLHSLGRCPAA